MAFKFRRGIIFLAVLFFFIFPKAKAQEIFIFGAENLEINAEVKKNGELKITESFNLFDELTSSFWWSINSRDIKNLEIYRNNQKLPPLEYQTRIVQNQTIIFGLQNFSNLDSWRIIYQLKGDFTPRQNNLEFRYQPIKNPGLYISHLTLNIHFPQKLDPQKTLQNLYAIHGVDNPKYYYFQNSLVYEGENLSPYSSFTAVANLDKDLVNVPLGTRILSFLKLGGLDFWAVMTIVLPLLTFTVLSIIIWIRRKRENISTPEKALSRPPFNMDPILVGLLFRQKISAREIAAEILNLAIKKYLIINQKYEGYTLGERQLAINLKSYDQALIDELLKGHLKETLANLKELPQKELFSQAIFKVFNTAYNAIAEVGYFVKNPKIVIMRYKIFGATIFFLSVIAFFTTPFFVEPPYIIFAFFGAALASLLIFELSSSMPYRTKEGQAALLDWLAFRKFLIEYPQKPGFNEMTQGQFIEYLPYAVVLDCEKEWADHFVSVPFQMPDWYTPYVYSEMSSLTEFTKTLYPLIDSISNTMLAMKEPIL